MKDHFFSLRVPKHRTSRDMQRLTLSIALLALSLWQIPVFAHFALAPKIAIDPLPLPQADQRLFQAGEVVASRGQFSAYLERLTAFETKYQRVQPSFSAHFNLLRGVAFFHPDNIHTFIDRVDGLRSQPAMYQFAVGHWIKGQIGVYARLMRLLQMAKQNQQQKTPDVVATLDFYAAGVKTALLEELIVLGDMEPSVAGMRAFIANEASDATRLIDLGTEASSDLIPPEEQRRLKKRWRQFRQDLVGSTHQINRCQSIQTFSEPGATVILEVGERQLTLADYLAIFGVPKNERQWAGQRRGNCARMVLFYAMAGFVDSLNILPQRLAKDIQISGDIFLMGAQLSKEAAAALLAKEAAGQTPLQRMQHLMEYPKVIEVKDWLITQKPTSRNAATAKYIDQEFLDRTEWRLERILAPQHSIHM